MRASGDEYKLRRADGSVQHDTLILPPAEAAALGVGTNVAVLFSTLQALPEQAVGEPLKLEPMAPKWVKGAHATLNYRGRAIKRDTMWFQRDMTSLLRYGYTGACRAWRAWLPRYSLCALPR